MLRREGAGALGFPDSIRANGHDPLPSIHTQERDGSQDPENGTCLQVTSSPTWLAKGKPACHNRPSRNGPCGPRVCGDFYRSSVLAWPAKPSAQPSGQRMPRAKKRGTQRCFSLFSPGTLESSDQVPQKSNALNKELHTVFWGAGRLSPHEATVGAPWGGYVGTPGPVPVQPPKLGGSPDHSPGGPGGVRGLGSGAGFQGRRFSLPLGPGRKAGVQQQRDPLSRARGPPQFCATISCCPTRSVRREGSVRSWSS